ncbi:MAG: DNA polymerase III subunit beta [Clostridiaceae bacterium]|jgi:DNA polymerase-3 subunit beta|nr:DNA polymerase III subunit beta [Bacillota bacterium]NLI38740.1 DNA polymerase III subunit beta [Clostridiaceae bacterium]
MKIIVLKQNLIEAINIVQRAVMTKATLPILEGIYIEAGEKVKLVGNCYDLGIECCVDADIQQKGSIVIEAKMFGEIIRKLPDAPVYIEVLDGFKVRIECLNSYFEIRGMDGDTYPMPPEYEGEISLNLPQSVFKELIRQTIFAVGNDENRKIMTGVLMEAQQGELKMAALDGFRMAVCSSVIKEDINFKVVIPGRNMQEILRVLDTSDENLSISLAGNLTSFGLKNCRIVSKVLEGEFMNYQSYIPTQFETVINVNTRELEESMERASLITSDDKRYPVRINLSDDRMVISSTTEKGRSKEEIHIENSGNTMQIGFNPRYFLDALKVINDEKVKISFTSPVGPCILTPVEHDRFLFLILPVRLKN